MAGSPFYGGLFEGFNASREANYQQSLKSDAEARATEGKIYEYLLQSRDPEIQSLALSGLFESARPGSRAKGMRGFLGEVQGGEIYPKLRQAMDQQVPDEAPPPAPPQPGSAALPSTTPVHGGRSGSFINPSGTAETSPGGFMSPRAAAGAGTGIAGAAMEGQPAPAAPPGLPAPQPPPEHPTHRRGTGVPTAEEVAAASEGAKTTAHIQAITGALRAAGADDQAIQRAIMGISGAPIPLDTTGPGPVMADPSDPSTPIPTVRHRNGDVTLIDGSPVTPGLVGWIKAGAQKNSTMEDKTSPTGYSKVFYDDQGTELYRVPTEYTPAPAYGGTAVTYDPNSPTSRSVTPVLRGGGTGAPLGPAPAPEGQATPDQAEAEGWVKAVDAKVKEGRLQGFPVPRGGFDKTTKQVTGGKYQTYQDLQKAAQKSGALGAPAAQSVADRVRARIEQNRAGTAAPAGPAR